MCPCTHALYKKEKVKRKIWSRIGFFLCLGMLLYPLAASMWNRYHSSLIAARYEEAVADKPDAYKEEWEKAQEYNAELVKTTHCVITSAEYEKDDTYESMLNAGGMMGYVEIPSIQVKEAIYHYSSDDVLQEGIGHIHGSSLPVGGETSHCVLTGHCGLPTQKFFTDLDKVKEGEVFYLHACGKTLAYKVDRIRVVLPQEVNSLQMEQGKDQVTLVTCTPYGVNSHRLLVTGQRIPYHEKEADEVRKENYGLRLDKGELAILGVLLFFFLLFLIRIIRNRKNR